MTEKTHVVLRGSRRAKDKDARAVGTVDGGEHLTVTVGIRGPKLPKTTFPTLTPEKFASQFGASKADSIIVTKELRKFGLRVTNASLTTRSLTVSGSASAMEAAFRPGMVIMRSARDGDYRGRSGTLQIPISLKGLITGVFGLDERRVARRSDASGTLNPSGVAPAGPVEIEQRYNFPPGDGANQTIAIAAFGGAYLVDDLAAYCKNFNRPAPTIKSIAVDAQVYTLQEILSLQPPSLSRSVLSDSKETMMDVQIIAGLCPKANISIYFATFTQVGWIALLDRVIADRPVALSISYGFAEDDPNWSANAISQIDARLNMARLLGITVCVSTGDDGSGDQVIDQDAHLDFPGSSPNTLAVGGTMLVKSGNSFNEVAWWVSPGQRLGEGGATGGGVSTIFQRPDWQNVAIASLNAGSIDGRVTPDVAALAGDPQYNLVFTGTWYTNGGTSAAAPVWAALVSRIDAQLPASKRQRFLTPLLYQATAAGQSVGASSFRDVTVGNNASNPLPGRGYSAGPGFDAVSGWGAPDGVKLLNALNAN